MSNLRAECVRLLESDYLTQKAIEKSLDINIDQLNRINQLCELRYDPRTGRDEIFLKE